MTVDKFEGLLELAEAPFLEGDRLVLGPLRAAHAEEMVVALSDPGLYRYTGGLPATLGELRARYERQAKGLVSRWRRAMVQLGREGARRRGGGLRSGHCAPGPRSRRGRTGVGDRGAVPGPRACKGAAGIMEQWLWRQGVRNFAAHVHPEHSSAAVAAHLGLSLTGLMEGGEVVWAGASGPIRR